MSLCIRHSCHTLFAMFGSLLVSWFAFLPCHSVRFDRVAQRDRKKGIPKNKRVYVNSYPNYYVCCGLMSKCQLARWPNLKPLTFTQAQKKTCFECLTFSLAWISFTLYGPAPQFKCFLHFRHSIVVCVCVIVNKKIHWK